MKRLQSKIVSCVSLIFFAVYTLFGWSLVYASSPSPKCYSPGVFDSYNGYCVTDPVDQFGECPDKYLYDSFLRKCISYPYCEGEYIYDPESRRCRPAEIGSVGGEPVSLSGMWCGSDKNHDGELSEEEIAKCIPVDDGYFCPLDAAECVPQEKEINCPSGYTYNEASGKCEAPPIEDCTINDYCDTHTFPSNEVAEVYTQPGSGDPFCLSIYYPGAGNTAYSTCIAPGECITHGIRGGKTIEFYVNGATYCLYYYPPNAGRSTWHTCVNVGYTPCCPDGGTYNTSTGKCETDDYTATCPEGTVTDECLACPYENSTCVKVDDKWMCSPYACGEIQDAEGGDEPPSGLEDDMGYDDEGLCLGNVYIFNGKKMRCRPSGLKTGFHNCCDEAQGKLYDSTGSTGMMLGDAIKAVYICLDLVKKAQFLNSVKAVELVSADKVKLLNEYGETIGVAEGTEAKVWTDLVENRGVATEVGDNIYQLEDFSETYPQYVDSYLDHYAPQLAAQIVTMALTRAIDDPVLSAAVDLVAQSILYTMNLASGWGIALAALNLGMSLFMGSCDKQDILTSTYKESGYCHYVGKKCIKKLFLVGCVQKAKVYCCFNSKLARIIHEQGRPQLSSFGPSGGWGDADNPNCRGFTPEEFQSIDFGRIDFSEYVADIQRNIRRNIEPQMKEIFQKSMQNF